MPASWNRNRLTAKLGIDYPIIQGLSSERLTAAVSNFGGLGSFGAHGLNPSAIKEAIADIRALTSKPLRSICGSRWRMTVRAPPAARPSRERRPSRDASKPWAALFRAISFTSPSSLRSGTGLAGWGPVLRVRCSVRSQADHAAVTSLCAVTRSRQSGPDDTICGSCG